MLQEALILALFTLRYIQHCYSSLEIQNAFKKPTIKPWFFTLQCCRSFQIASEWLPSNTVLCVIIQRLKLSRNPSSCGVCCIAFRRTSSPGEEAAPLTCRGGCPGPWAAALFPPPGPFWQSSDNCPHFCNPGGPSLPTCIFELPSWNNFYTKPSEDSTGCPLEVTDTASRGREAPEAKSVNLEPKLLGSVSCKFKIYRRLCCSHHSMTFGPTLCFLLRLDSF